jgi:hypothetical protein
MKKKILGVLIVLSLLLTACSGSGGPKDCGELKLGFTDNLGPEELLAMPEMQCLTSGAEGCSGAELRVNSADILVFDYTIQEEDGQCYYHMDVVKSLGGDIPGMKCPIPADEEFTKWLASPDLTQCEEVVQ